MLITSWQKKKNYFILFYNYSVIKILNSIFTSGFRLLDPTLPN